MLEQFLKYVFTYIYKDVSTLGVTTKEEAILRAQQMDLINAQSRILYEIIPEAPQSTHSIEKPKPGPHADGVFSPVNYHTIVSLIKLISYLKINNQLS